MTVQESWDVTLYNKLFTKILDSSIWLAPDPHRLVWITLIAAMDEDGNAMFACVDNLAARARVSVEHAESAIAAFEAPDSKSGDPDNDGRRVERFPGGWHILNADKYRSMVTKAVSRERTRIRNVAYRARQREGMTPHDGSETPHDGPLREPDAPVTPSEADTDTHVGSPSESPTRTSAAKKAPATRMPADFALTPERREIAVREKVDPDRTFLRFKNYWLAKGGQDARKHDWEATWVNWCMKEADGKQTGGGSRPERVSASERVRRATGVKL